MYGEFKQVASGLSFMGKQTHIVWILIRFFRYGLSSYMVYVFVIVIFRTPDVVKGTRDVMIMLLFSQNDVTTSFCRNDDFL